MVLTHGHMLRKIREGTKSWSANGSPNGLCKWVTQSSISGPYGSFHVRLRECIAAGSCVVPLTTTSLTVTRRLLLLAELLLSSIPTAGAKQATNILYPAKWLLGHSANNLG